MALGGFFTALATCLLAVQFVKLLWARRRLPPGPIPLPLIGSLWRVGWKIRQDTLMKLASSYGNVFTLWLGHLPVVVLSGFEAVKDGLTQDPEALSGRPVIPSFKVLGDEKGIMYSNGKTWKQQRYFGQATMQKLDQRKDGLEHQVKEEARQLVESFAREKGQPLDPSSPIMLSASRVICAVAFGHPVPIDNEALCELIKHIRVIRKFDGTAGDILCNIFPSLAQYLPEHHKEVFSSCEHVRSFIRKEVESHKKSKERSEPQDYIDFYMAKMVKEKVDATSEFDEDNLIQAILDLFAAGTDTITATLSWALLFMVTHPDVQEKVQKELSSALDPSKPVCYEDRKRLSYTNAVVNEILRFSNIVLFALPKLTVTDTNVLGHFIPKDTLVIPDLCSVLLDPKQWETPQQFNPNHFLDKDGNFKAREEFFPFGAGSRPCLGEHLARTELFIFLTSLLRAFTFQLPEGVKEVNAEPVIGATVHPHPYKLCAIAH
ncbi:hypothetical protein lerEdw1_015869 [Lerista edwardsae]|nr:hypothetical protein lerEdw1_015869 [Lerista edwardsae]